MREVVVFRRSGQISFFAVKKWVKLAVTRGDFVLMGIIWGRKSWPLYGVERWPQSRGFLSSIATWKSPFMCIQMSAGMYHTARSTSATVLIVPQLTAVCMDSDVGAGHELVLCLAVIQTVWVVAIMLVGYPSSWGAWIGCDSSCMQGILADTKCTHNSRWVCSAWWVRRIWGESCQLSITDL